LSSRRASIADHKASDACSPISSRWVATEAASGKSGESSDQARAFSSHSAVIGYSSVAIMAFFIERRAIPTQPAQIGVQQNCIVVRFVRPEALRRERLRCPAL